MRNPFARKTFPHLHRELLGYNFDTPVALEPVPAYRQAKWAVGASRFAFVELTPSEGTRPERLRKASGTVTAVNISNMTGRTAEELTRSVGSVFSRMYDYADMFVLDTFRPDTDGVVALQNADALSEVMDSLLETRRFYDSAKPLLVRIAPSIGQKALEDIVHYMRMSDADGIVAGSDTFAPELVRRVCAITCGRFPVIACGGISTPARAQEMLDTGADMVQVTKFGSRLILKSLQNNTNTSPSDGHLNI